MKMASAFKCEFGFLKRPIEGNFEGGSLSLLADHSKAVEWFVEASNLDGFFYPPEMATYTLDHRTMKKKKKVERSERPASVFHLPPSHVLAIESAIDESNEKRADAAFIIYLLGYVYGTRLQFPDWGFDCRVPEKPTNNIYIADKTCLHFVGHAYQFWRCQTENVRTRLTNILYVLARARCLQWDWESFFQQYMVFDAIWKLHTTLNPQAKSDVSHKGRFAEMISHYGLFPNPDLVTKIYGARNNLFHEALWVGATIGFGCSNQDAYYYPYHLGRLNSRLICGVLNYQNKSSKSTWDAMGTFEFDTLA